MLHLTDACTLREDYRIAGNLTGCLPQKPRQNVHLALPLQLLPEETTLLKELGIVRLVDGNQPLSEPTEAEVQKYKQHLDDVYEQQVEGCRQDRLTAIERQKEVILEGKRLKKRRLNPHNHEAEQEEEEEVTLDDITIAPLARKNSHVQIPTEPVREVTYREAEWNFPNTEAETLRYRVFKDLWHKQHFLTGGVKFGGDFLVYPGDPARYHSFYIAVCVPHSQALTPLELASMGRLGSTVKKTVLLCSLDDSDQLSYLSLNWSHIS